MMDADKDLNFLKFCGDDIKKFHHETDPSKKPPILRRINMQMYAEACKSNYSDYMVCKMLSDDMDEYIKCSAPVQQTKFDDMLKNLNINVEPGTLHSKLKNPVVKFPDTQKCKQTCQNDKLLTDLDEFFNSKIRRPIPPKTNQTPNVAPVVKDSSNSSKPVKISVDESNGDLVFDTDFWRNRERKQNQPHTSASTDNRFAFQSRLRDTNQITEQQPVRQDNRFVPTAPAKRKPDEVANDVFKRPNYAARHEPNYSSRQEQNSYAPRNDFISASEELVIQHNKKYGSSGNQADNNTPYNTNPNGGIRKSLGGRRTVNNKFIPPYANEDNNSNNTNKIMDCNQPESSLSLNGIDMSHPRLKNVDPKMAETISNEIMDQCDRVDWSSIAGLEYAKKTLMEAVVLPILRPDIFTGLRQPPRGVLLFGPPGTGKTMIGKCIASQSKSTFFSISASCLTSKWIGEGEKMVRALFAVAAAVQPSVVFIDEVDSLLCQRSESEHESSRRLKTEFLVQLDGASSTEKDRILIVGATNRPQELDEAARRRFVKRLYIPLPNVLARREILLNLLASVDHVMTESQFEEIAHRTDGFSGADMKVLCQEAVMGPVRSISFTDMESVDVESVRAVNFADFINALECVRASVSQDDLQQYVDWNEKYGSGNGR